MKREEISEAVSNISSQYIEEAADFHRKEKSEGKHFTIRKAAAVAAAVVLVFTVSVPVLAVMDFEAAYHLLYLVSPEIAQKLKPVRMSCEDNGIKMEVVSAYVEGSEAKVLISVQDLEGDRIDGTTILLPGFSLQTVSDCKITCESINYDAETKTATFLLSISQAEDIAGDKITICVRGMWRSWGKEEVAILGDEWETWTSQNADITGNWSVTFPLESVSLQTDQSNTPQ